MRLIIKNVTVVNSDGALIQDVFVEDGKITGAFDSADREIDGTGKFLLPGAIDAHVHFREPGASHKETWETGSAAAAMGGVTTVLDMPNNNPAIISVKTLNEKRALIEGRSFVNYGFHFGAAGTGNLEEIRAAKNIPGVKIYMGSSTGDLLVDQPSQWEKVFEVCREKNIPVIVHAENEHRIQERAKAMAGETAMITHAKIRDCECAKIAAHEAIALHEQVGNKLHIAHMSTAAELALVEASDSSNLTCEVAPHHLYFTMNDMKDANLKMNPPLREEADLIKLWEGVHSGTVNCIATDHAPHTKEEKSKGLASPSGVPGVEFMLPLMLNESSQNSLELTEVARLTSAEPARIFSLQGKGTIKEGMDADLVLVDMELEKTITEAMVQSKCGWTPYLGYKLKGWPVMTIVNGQITMESGKVSSTAFGKEVIINP
ncbi:MAG: dihydroorotase [Oceanicoccus sp.]|jgi:dihydroorotase